MRKRHQLILRTNIKYILLKGTIQKVDNYNGKIKISQF